MVVQTDSPCDDWMLTNCICSWWGSLDSSPPFHPSSPGSVSPCFPQDLQLALFLKVLSLPFFILLQSLPPFPSAHTSTWNGFVTIFDYNSSFYFHIQPSVTCYDAPLAQQLLSSRRCFLFSSWTSLSLTLAVDCCRTVDIRAQPSTRAAASCPSHPSTLCSSSSTRDPLTHQ